MRMITIFLAACLASGCGTTGKAPKADPVTITVTVPQTAPAQVPQVSKKEWKKLTRDCETVEVPTDDPSKPVGDLAIDVANARKAALEECTARMRKLRKKGA